MEGEEFPTKNEDLAGFWDMLMLQVVQVHELFAQIELLKKTQWKEVRPDSINPKLPSSSTSRHTKKSKIAKLAIDINKPQQFVKLKVSKKLKECPINTQDQWDRKLKRTEKYYQDINEKLDNKSRSKMFIDYEPEFRRPHSRTFNNFNKCLNQINVDQSVESKCNFYNFSGLKSEAQNLYFAEAPYKISKNNMIVVGHCAPSFVKCDVSGLVSRQFEKSEDKNLESSEPLIPTDPGLNLKMHRTHKSENIQKQRISRSLSPIKNPKKVPFTFPNKNISFVTNLKRQIDNSISSGKSFLIQKHSTNTASLKNPKTQASSKKIVQQSGKSRPRLYSPEIKSPDNIFFERQKTFCTSLDKRTSLENKFCTDISPISKRNSSIESEKETRQSREKKNMHHKTSLRSRSLDARQKSKLSVTFADDTNLHKKISNEKDDILAQHHQKKSTDHCSIVNKTKPIDFLSVDRNNLQIKSYHLKRTESILRIQNSTSSMSNGTSKIKEASGKESDKNLKLKFQSHIPVLNSSRSTGISSKIAVKDKTINQFKETTNKFCSSTIKFQVLNKLNSYKADKNSSLNIKNSENSKLRPPSSYKKKLSLNDYDKLKIRSNSKCIEKIFSKEYNNEDVEDFNLNRNNDAIESQGNKIQISNLNKNETIRNSRSISDSSRRNEKCGNFFIRERSSKSLDRGQIEKDLDDKDVDKNRQSALSCSESEKNKNVSSSRILSVSPRRKIDSANSFTSTETVVIKRSLKSLEKNTLDGSENRKYDIKTHQNSISDLKLKELPIKNKRICVNKSRLESPNMKKNFLKKGMTQVSIESRPGSSSEKQNDFITTEKYGLPKNLTNQRKLSVITNVWCNLNLLHGANSQNDKTKKQEESEIIEISKNVRILNIKNINEVNLNRSMVLSKSVSKSILQTSKITLKNNLRKKSKETILHLSKKHAKPLLFSNARKLVKMKKYYTKLKARLIGNSTKASLDSKFISDKVNSDHHQEILKTEETKNEKYVESFESLFNERVSDKIRLDHDIRSSLNENENCQRIISNVIPWKNSDVKEIMMERQIRSPTTVSLSSSHNSETSLARAMLETSRIIRSKSKIKGLFYTKLLTRINYKNPLLGIDRYLPVKRENAEFKIHRTENDRFLESKSNGIISNIESYENINSVVNIRHTCNFLVSNKAFCQLSLYLYVYGLLSIILVMMKINPCKYCFLDNRIFHNYY